MGEVFAEYQCTIKKEVSIEGIGLHTGKKTLLRFKKAKEETGIVFVRKDLPGSPQIPARVEYANHRDRSTSLQKGNLKVNIIEHVMAAVAGVGIDNLIIEINNIEPPVLDGSAKPFAEILKKAGKKIQDKKKKFFTPSPFPFW